MISSKITIFSITCRTHRMFQSKTSKCAGHKKLARVLLCVRLGVRFQLVFDLILDRRLKAPRVEMQIESRLYERAWE